MFSRILVGVDGSAIARAAAGLAGRLAAEGGGTLTLAHIVPPAPAFVDAAALTLVDYDRRAQQEGYRILAEVRAALPAGVQASETVLHGPPAAALVEEAKRGGFDLLVVGSHGRTGLSRFLLGSVAAQVVAHATIPVLVYRSASAPDGSKV